MTWRTWFLMTHSLQWPGVGRGLKSMRASPLQAWRALSGSLVRGLRSIQPYSPREVRARLLEDVSRGNPRTAAVHAAAADIAAWTRLLPNDACREHRLGLAASRLPEPDESPLFGCQLLQVRHTFPDQARLDPCR